MELNKAFKIYWQGFMHINYLRFESQSRQSGIGISIEENNNNWVNPFLTILFHLVRDP